MSDHAELHARLVAELNRWFAGPGLPMASRQALFGILELHRPNTVRYHEPCEQHIWRVGAGKMTDIIGPRNDCPNCTVTPVVQCSVTDCSWRDTPCPELEVIAEAVFLDPDQEEDPDA